MFYRRFKLPLLLALSVFAAACLTNSPRQGDNNAAGGAMPEMDAKGGHTKAVVLFDVNWGRRWSCGGFQTAELHAIGFDRFPLVKTKNDEPFDISFTSSPAQGTASCDARQPALPCRLPPAQTRSTSARGVAKPGAAGYDSLAFWVEPGDYALGGFMIMVARSANNSEPLTTKRSELIKGGKSLGGTFSAREGETVYLGNFVLDCSDRPQLARAYTKGASNYKAHLAEYKRMYPFIQTEQVVFRLFQSAIYGEPRSK